MYKKKEWNSGSEGKSDLPNTLLISAGKKRWSLLKSSDGKMHLN